MERVYDGFFAGRVLPNGESPARRTVDRARGVCPSLTPGQTVESFHPVVSGGGGRKSALTCQGCNPILPHPFSTRCFGTSSLLANLL